MCHRGLHSPPSVSLIYTHTHAHLETEGRRRAESWLDRFAFTPDHALKSGVIAEKGKGSTCPGFSVLSRFTERPISAPRPCGFQRRLSRAPAALRGFMRLRSNLRTSVLTGALNSSSRALVGQHKFDTFTLVEPIWRNKISAQQLH